MLLRRKCFRDALLVCVWVTKTELCLCPCPCPCHSSVLLTKDTAPFLEVREPSLFSQLVRPFDESYCRYRLMVSNCQQQHQPQGQTDFIAFDDQKGAIVCF